MVLVTHIKEKLRKDKSFFLQVQIFSRKNNKIFSLYTMYIKNDG